MDRLTPGVYRGLSAAEYHALPYASNSRLSKLVPPSTPAHMKAALDEPPKDKKAWKEGRALHACILEPERYEREYRVADGCRGTTQKGGACKASPTFAVEGGAACHNHVGDFAPDPEAVLVSPKDDRMVRACRARFRSHAMAGGFLNVPDADYELSIVWDQDIGGGLVVRCKARIDWYSPSFMGGLPMDLKGAVDASEREFKRAAFYNGYLRQSVLYRLGLRALGLPARTFAVVAQEKETPFELMVYMLGDMATGPLPEPGEDPVHVAATVLSALRLWSWCETNQRWPGYAEVVTDLSTDEWAWSAMQDQAGKINEFLKGRAA